jgi:hypothetical protein
MDTCNICGSNAIISECKTCLIKCCRSCRKRHIDSCNILKDDKYHQCQHHEQLVNAFCCHCYQLICKECVVYNHFNLHSEMIALLPHILQVSIFNTLYYFLVQKRKQSLWNINWYRFHVRSISNYVIVL